MSRYKTHRAAHNALAFCFHTPWNTYFDLNSIEFTTVKIVAVLA